MLAKLDILGAALAMTSAIISNLGVNVQKYSHSLNDNLPLYQKKNYIYRPLWWIGLAFVVVGSIGDFAAFGFATQTLVASLGGGSTLIANVIIAQYYNQEKLYQTDLAGVVWVVIGVLIIAVITDPDREYSLHELEMKFIRPGFIVYISIVVLSMLSMLARIKGSYAHRIKNQLQFTRQRQKRLMKQYERRFQALETKLSSLENKIIGFPDKEERGNNILKQLTYQEQLDHVDDVMEGVMPDDLVPYYYAVCSGIVGAITVLLAKCSALLIFLTMRGHNQFDEPLSFVFLGGMAICILVQTHLLNMATTLGDIQSVFPIFQAFWICFSVIGGIVFYETQDEITTFKLILYPISLICITIGIYYLTQHEGRKRAELIQTHQHQIIPDGIDDAYTYRLNSTTSMLSPLLNTENDD